MLVRQGVSSPKDDLLGGVVKAGWNDVKALYRAEELDTARGFLISDVADAKSKFKDVSRGSLKLGCFAGVVSFNDEMCSLPLLPLVSGKE